MEKLIVKEGEIEVVDFDCGGGSIAEYKSKPFTGIDQSFDKEGRLYYELEYVDGYEEGIERTYYPNGQIKEEYQLRDNKAVKGTYRSFKEDGTTIVDETQ